MGGIGGIEGMGRTRGMGGIEGMRGIGGMGGIGGMKFVFFILQVQNTGHQVTQVRLNQRDFWVKNGLKMEFSENGCA